MQTISREYVAQNAALHAARADYGTSGHRWAKPIADIARILSTCDVLDYGCGKGTLQRVLGFPIHEYDPAIAAKSARPAPAALVACTDVLEHIEPEYLDAVLDDIRALTLRAVFLSVATRPAKKSLPDGRNAHLIIQPAAWWLERLCKRFEPLTLTNSPGDSFVFVGAVL